MQPYGYDYAGRPYGIAIPQGYGQAQPMPIQQTVPMPQPAQQGYPQAPPPMQQPQIRSGGIVSVPNEAEARRYPVAPGYTVTMRDESAPYLYEKTMGFSQLEQPVFRKARIVFEDDAPQSAQEPPREPEAPQPVYAELAQLEALRDAMVADMRDIRGQLGKETAEIRSLVAAMIKPEAEPKKSNRKKEADDE